jgi:hypothetical protein
MSLLLKVADKHYEVDEGILARYAISAREFEAKSVAGMIADRDLLAGVYSEAVQIGCGCCTDKKTLGASCLD